MSFRFAKFIASNLKKPIFWIAIAAASIAFLVNVSPARTSDAAIAKESKQASAQDLSSMQREGAKLAKVVGTFQQSSGRFCFVPKSNPKQNYCCLENLMLQRVAVALGEQSSFAEWKISGELTEFQDANYLIIQTAERAE